MEAAQHAENPTAVIGGRIASVADWLSLEVAEYRQRVTVVEAMRNAPVSQRQRPEDESEADVVAKERSRPKGPVEGVEGSVWIVTEARLRQVVDGDEAARPIGVGRRPVMTPETDRQVLQRGRAEAPVTLEHSGEPRLRDVTQFSVHA